MLSINALAYDNCNPSNLTVPCKNPTSSVTMDTVFRSGSVTAFYEADVFNWRINPYNFQHEFTQNTQDWCRAYTWIDGSPFGCANGFGGPQDSGNFYWEGEGSSFELSSNVDPENSGSIILDPSGGSYTPGTQVEIEASPSTGYAFSNWEWNNGASSSTENPMTINIDSAKTVKAKFYRTFRNAVGDFRYAVNVNREERGECVIYVRDETDISYDGCHGDAEDCLSLAQTAGYSTGSVPKVGAIAVFSSNTFPNSGHVGIVKEIISETSILLRHSNFSTYHTVSEEAINTTSYPVTGYIYPTYPMP